MTKNRDDVKYLNRIQKGLLLIIFSIFFIPIVTADNYTGDSSICKTCHEVQYKLWTNSTHTSKLITRDDAIARGYPNPPGGYSWENVSLVIGSKWKIRYVNDTGYIITNGGKNQFNIDDQVWTDYNKDTSKPYICGNCHNTGYLSNVTDTVKEPFRTLRAQGKIPDGIYNNSLTPGFIGYWAENSIGCEACHGQGGDHVNNPSKLNIRNASVLRNTPGICGNCHSRPNTGEYENFKPYPYGVNDTFLNDTLYDSSPMPTFNYSKVGGHHEQWEDWKASVHSNKSVNCVTCHGGHSVSDPAYAGGPTGKTKFTNGSVYPAAVNKTCTDCHSITPAKHGYYTNNSECISCHMPINRKSANKMDLRSHWFNVNALKDNKNGDPHATANFGTLQSVTESCTTCHSSANLSKPIDIASAGVHKDVNKLEGIGLLNSSDCKSCHYDASASSILSRNCDACHVDQVITSPKVDEHTGRSTDVAVTASCALCHNNSINKFKYNNSASVSHYGTVNSLINTSNCIDCHNGAYTGNASWGSPVNISTSTKRQHTETQTSQCDSCHKDSSVPTLAAVTFHNASVKTGLPPPVNQNIGIKDSKFDQYRSSETNPNQTLCRNCHELGGDKTIIPNRHHRLVETGEINPVTGIAYGCNNCHPVLSGPTGQVVFKERECLQCHSGLNWSRVDPTNATKAKVNVSRPHHINTAAAAARQCNQCHGSYIANYDDGHYVPDYGASNVTPTTHYKVYNATSGRYWGGCFACHQGTNATDPDLFDSYGTHHTATNGQRTDALDHQGDRTPGVTCNWCHTTYWNTTTNSERPIGYPDEMQFEVRNNTLLSIGDTINGTGCEKCHDVGTIHNIQKDYGSGIAGKGHIETNWDCNGCHAYWDAGESGFENLMVPELTSVSPGKLSTGVGATLTLTGTDFLTGTGTTNPISDVVSIDGIRYTPTSITDTQIVVDVPGLTEGVHAIQVIKTGDYAWQEKLSKLLSIVVIDPVDVTSATLVKTRNGPDVISTITVSGSGFGSQPPAEFTEFGVTVTTTYRGQPVTYAMQVTSWSDIQIVGTVTSAAVGDPVTVNALYGSDTVALTQG